MVAIGATRHLQHADTALATDALVTRRHAEVLAVALGEVRRGHEATGRGHLDDRQRRLLEQLTRAGQAQLEVVARRRTVQIPLEQPLQLTARDIDIVRQLVQADGLFQIGLHQRDDFQKLGLGGAQHMLERHALLVLLATYAITDEHLGDARRQLAAMLATDHGQHHVHRRGTAGGRGAVLIDGEQSCGQRHAREGFLHRGQALPVDAGLMAFEQPCLGQRPAAGADGTQLAAGTCLGLQPADMRAMHGALNADSTAHDDDIQRRAGLGGGIGRDLQAIAGAHGGAFQRHGIPAVQLASGQLIGHAQRFHRRGQRDEREAVEQQEADGLRLARLAGHSCSG